MFGLLADRLADAPRGPHVEAIGRLAVDDHLGIKRELSGEHDLLNIPARQRADPRLRAGRADVEASDQLARFRKDLRVPDAAALPVGRLADLLQHNVHRHRHGADRPLVQSVVGDVAKSQLLRCATLDFASE